MKTCFSEGKLMKQFGNPSFWENLPPFQLTRLFLNNIFMTPFFVQILKTRTPSNYTGGGNYDGGYKIWRFSMGLLFSNRLHWPAGVQLFRGINRRSMAVSGKKMAYERVRTTSSKASPPDISQESKIYFNSHTNGQHSDFDISEKKWWGTKNQKMTILSKEIWEILISKQIMINVEYQPSSLNEAADLESRRKVDPSEWVHCRHVFRKSLSKIRNPNSRFIPFKDVTPSSTICCMETLAA